MLHYPATVELYWRRCMFCFTRKHMLYSWIFAIIGTRFWHMWVGRGDGLTSMKHVLLSYINITQREMCTVAIPGAASYTVNKICKVKSWIVKIDLLTMIDKMGAHVFFMSLCCPWYTSNDYIKGCSLIQWWWAEEMRRESKKSEDEGGGSGHVALGDSSTC